MGFRSGAGFSAPKSLIDGLGDRVTQIARVPGVFDRLAVAWIEAKDSATTEPALFQRDDEFGVVATESLKLAVAPYAVFKRLASRYRELLESKNDSSNQTYRRLGLSVAGSLDLEFALGELLCEMILHEDRPVSEDRGLLGLLEEALLLLAIYDGMALTAQHDPVIEDVTRLFEDVVERGDTICFLLGDRHAWYVEQGRALGPALWEAMRDHVTLAGVSVMAAELTPTVKQFEEEMSRLKGARDGIRNASPILDGIEIPSTMADLNISDYDASRFMDEQLQMSATPIRNI